MLLRGLTLSCFWCQHFMSKVVVVVTHTISFYKGIQEPRTSSRA